MVAVIIASIVYINNSTGLFNYIGETYNELTSTWLVNMYVEGKIDTLILTDKSERIKEESKIERKGGGYRRYLEYLANKKKSSHLKVILKNTSSKTLPVKISINFYDANDNLFLEKYPLPYTWLKGGEVDTLVQEYFTLPAEQIERIKRYELKVFYNKITSKKSKGF